MAKVNSESANMDKMRQHQLTKTKVTGDALKHEDGDLMVCTDLIDQSRSLCLNGSTDHAAILDVLRANPEDKALTSDVDPQLLLKIYFKEKVNLSSIVIRFNAPPTPGESDADEVYSKPQLIKIFTNLGDLDFGDIDSTEPACQRIVDSEAAEEVRIPCVGHKFQRLESLQVLVEEPQDAEASRSFINRLSIVGHQAESFHAHYA
mmetsp:Transcript_77996/g.135167  ORF Transcript_77996/g.135167 Transcript_77996/m.135167 type:complete len:205 (-) Transcript_77996:97-711(-)